MFDINNIEAQLILLLYDIDGFIWIYKKLQTAIINTSLSLINYK